MSMLATTPRPRAASPWAATITLGWRAMLKIKHVPFQLFDVTAFPLMMTLMFTYLFGGALAGSVGAYVQYLIPGIVVQTIVFITVYTGVGLNADISKGLFDRFRSVPIWQPAPIFGALLGDVFRYSLAATMVITLGLIMGFRPTGGVLRGARRRADHPVRDVALVDVDHRRHAREVAGVGDDVELPAAVPADDGEQHLRRPADHAGLAAESRRAESGDAPRQRVAGPDARQRRPLERRLGARRHGGDHGG